MIVMTSEDPELHRKAWEVASAQLKYVDLWKLVLAALAWLHQQACCESQRFIDALCRDQNEENMTAAVFTRKHHTGFFNIELVDKIDKTNKMFLNEM